MKFNYKYLIPITLLLVINLILSIKLAKYSEPEFFSQSKMLGKPVPIFELESPIDSSMLSNHDLRSKYSLINFFGSWCLSCVAEHKQLKKLKENGLEIFGVNWKDNPEKLKKWLWEHGNPYEKIGSDKNGKTAIDFGIIGTPESFLINPSGEIILHHPGPLTDDTVVAIALKIK